MAEMSVAVIESKEAVSFTDLVVIRPSVSSRKDRIQTLVRKLALKGFLPIVQPHKLEEYDSGEDKWFPTDSFRDIGSKILVKSRYGLNDVLKLAEPIIGSESVGKLNQKTTNFYLAGGHFVHLNDQKRLLYDADEGTFVADPGELETSYRKADEKNVKEQFDKLRKEGWRIDPIHHGNFLIGEGKIRQDFDFVFSLFLGKDCKPHALVHPALFYRIPLDIQAHQIPEDEVLKGGCNPADLRGGKVLVCSNSKDTPIAFETLNKFAQAEIIEAPRYFVDGGGGPRCSISSLSLR